MFCQNISREEEEVLQIFSLNGKVIRSLKNGEKFFNPIKGISPTLGSDIKHLKKDWYTVCCKQYGYAVMEAESDQ